MSPEPSMLWSSVTAPVGAVVPRIVGASLVPAMVTVTSWLTVPPLWSSSVTV